MRAALPGTSAERGAAHRALIEGSKVLGLALTELQCQQLLAYAELITRWGRVHNLSGTSGLKAIVHRHVLDSLAVVPCLERETAGRAIGLLDVGSGAGLPGVVLAVARPAWAITCIDAAAKKAAFIRQVAGEIGLRNLQAVHGRVESMAPGSRCDIVISRAFASLADFVRLTADRIAPGGAWVAMKGRIPHAELTELSDKSFLFHVEPIAVPGVAGDRCLVWIRPH